MVQHIIKKYPQAFEIFKPVCRSVDLQKCSKQELVNAYDNTILYTDYFVNEVITILKNNNEVPECVALPFRSRRIVRGIRDFICTVLRMQLHLIFKRTFHLYFGFLQLFNKNMD